MGSSVVSPNTRGRHSVPSPAGASSVVAARLGPISGSLRGKVRRVQGLFAGIFSRPRGQVRFP